MRVSATTQVVSGPDYGSLQGSLLLQRRRRQRHLLLRHGARGRQRSPDRRHGGEQGSTHLEEVTAKPVSGFLTPSRDAEEAPVNTFDFTCELDPEADTVTLNLWLNGEHVLEAVDQPAAL